MNNFRRDNFRMENRNQNGHEGLFSAKHVKINKHFIQKFFINVNITSWFWNNIIPEFSVVPDTAEVFSSGPKFP